MPQWASSVVPEGSLVRQITNKEQTEQHQQIKNSINYHGTSSSSGANTARRPPPSTTSNSSLQNQSHQSHVVSFARQMEENMNVKQSTAHPNTNRTWDSTSTNPVFGQLGTGNNHNNNNHNNHQNIFSTDFTNIQYSTDPVTQNLKNRALAANGTFGAKQNVIPTHIRSVVSTLRRNVDDMKRFATEIPVLTTSEMPSATKRLAALLYAQTIAVDDLCRFTEDELKFASGKFYDLVSQMMELQFGKEDEDVLKGLIDEIVREQKRNDENATTTRHHNQKDTCDSWCQTQVTPEEESEQVVESETLHSSNYENDDETTTTPLPKQHVESEQQLEEESYFAEASSSLSPQTKFTKTKQVRKLLLETSPNNRNFLSQLSQAAATSPKSPRSRSPLSSVPRTSDSIINPATAYLSKNLGIAVNESLKELNAFRSLYSMLAGVANITGASEGRLFLFPSSDLLATSQDLFKLHREQDQRNYALMKQKQQRLKQEQEDNNTNDETFEQKESREEMEDFFNQAEEEKASEKIKNAKVMDSLDPEKLYLVAQVQSTPFASIRTATAPRDVVRIAESVAETRCAANLTPGIARVRASFTSLIAVPLFVTKQPESAVLGVLVLTNKTLANSSGGLGKKTRHQQNEHDEEKQHQEGDESAEKPNSIVSRLSESNSATANLQNLMNHFENSAGSNSWVTRGFFHDDEHKAVIAAEMMSWFVEKIPTGVVMRGAVRMTPSGFAEEWSNWASKPGANSISSATKLNNSPDQLLLSSLQRQLANPVLDPLMAMQQVPRRRFVFRTEDPREVAATGKLKLQSEKGFSQATTSSSGGGDLHVNSRKAQAAAFAKVTKTRSLISPESGEYLVNVAQSHRKMETKTDDLEIEVAKLKRQVESVKNELDAERTLRKQAEDAAHSMQVACDRIVRKSILANTHATTGGQQHHSPAPPPSTSQSQPQQQNYQRRPTSSSNNNNTNQNTTSNNLLFEQDLVDYTAASRPYSKPNITVKGATYSSANSRPTTSSSISPEPQQQQMKSVLNMENQNNLNLFPPVPTAVSREGSESTNTNNNNNNNLNLNNSSSSGKLMSMSQLLAASSIPISSQASKAVPSFHAPPPNVSDYDKMVMKEKSKKKQNVKGIPHDSHSMTRRVF